MTRETSEPAPADGLCPALRNVAYVDSSTINPSPSHVQRVSALLGALTDRGIVVHKSNPPDSINEWLDRLAKVPLIGKLVRAVAYGREIGPFLSGLSKVPDLVIVLGTDPRSLARAQRWCRKRKVPIVSDVLDLYQFRDGLTVGTGVFNVLSDRWGFRRLAMRSDGAIVVTSLLADHFERAGVPVLTVPALMTGTHGVPAGPQSTGLHIGFASTPLKSDTATLRNVIDLARRDEIPAGVTIHLVGTVPKSLQPLEAPSLVWHGLRPRGEAVQILSGCQFTLLQRPSERWALAGFPSKVAESLLLGKPVIANLWGDMGDYLKDHENAIIVADEGADALAAGLRLAMAWAESGSGPDSVAIAAAARRDFSPEENGDRIVSFLASVAAPK